MSYDVTFYPDGDTDERLIDGTVYVRKDGAVLSSNPDELWRNYTSNVSGMWTLALGQNLGDMLDPEPLAETLIEPLNRGIAEMMESPEVFRAMNPKNGWGDYEGALAYLVWIRDTAVRYPTAKVHVRR